MKFSLSLLPAMVVAIAASECPPGYYAPNESICEEIPLCKDLFILNVAKNRCECIDGWYLYESEDGNAGCHLECPPGSMPNEGICMTIPECTGLFVLFPPENRCVCKSGYFMYESEDGNVGCHPECPSGSIQNGPICVANASSKGDPHFKTFHNEHFEFHGQCDIVMASVKNFANKNIDLAIHLRTKMVRFWSYIESAAIRIGNDILEVKGSAENNGKLQYWINFETNGVLSDGLAGFPMTISPRNNKVTVDMDSAYQGLKIEIGTFKEFVSVEMIGATEESFGNSVGIIGNFKTGKTLARDGHTVLHDFNDLGLEWQVLPSDGKLFHEIATPQFPELCLLPEDPRGDRARRLAESTISVEDAEAACASLKDPLTIKDCVYDILATQDMDMVGAF